MFVVAAVTYLLTLEPTASFWDCGEFISQGYKLEVGHPPGNPIFMLAARFFVNFASGPETVAICVNAMSALLSAGIRGATRSGIRRSKAKFMPSRRSAQPSHSGLF